MSLVLVHLFLFNLDIGTNCYGLCGLVQLLYIVFFCIHYCVTVTATIVVAFQISVYLSSGW